MTDEPPSQAPPGTGDEEESIADTSEPPRPPVAASETRSESPEEDVSAPEGTPEDREEPGTDCTITPPLSDDEKPGAETGCSTPERVQEEPACGGSDSSWTCSEGNRATCANTLYVHTHPLVYLQTLTAEPCVFMLQSLRL